MGEIKKQLMIIGIVILLVVGLSGCIRRGKEVSLPELCAHPDKYYGKEIIVEGTYSGIGTLFDREGHIFYALPSDDFEGQINLFFSGEYKFKGIVKKAPLFSGGPEEYYLEITDAYDPNEIFIPGFEFAILIMAIAGLVAFRKRRNTERWLK